MDDFNLKKYLAENKLLKENNDKDYDIIIDDNMFENKETKDGEES